MLPEGEQESLHKKLLHGHEVEKGKYLIIKDDGAGTDCRHRSTWRHSLWDGGEAPIKRRAAGQKG